MFPIRDHNPSSRTPWVTYALIAANIVVFLANWQLFETPRALDEFYAAFAVIPARVSYGEGVETLVTSMFLHGGVMHLLGNMLFLYIFGDNLEDEMGHLPFALFYVACGVGAGLVHVVSAPGSIVPTIGASGAIAGVMGGYLLLFPRARVDILIILIIIFRVVPIPAWLMLALWFGMQFVGGLGSDPMAGGVAYWAHAGGFVIGILLTLPLWVRLGGPRYWSLTDGHPPHPDSRYRSAWSDVPIVRRKS
ncbi:Membrane associated serine protease, rhomboid family [Poseidonocella pacifica]|uniref:Membrane associated serine protease, rhomboid family n=1 Tax=Poseidonocella pacifica TaxID=871651 RepID=A0A1I0WBE9_9RHOB|nr:rhomboid family intramembrane serine protease [Poseidonocella pacifica]SFA85226.1 Membrane associated serine protease, rhomboid family [Poseidonocella pacifica]